jgi:hypothetical protein
VCLAAKPLINIAPLPSTTIKTLITTANTDGMELLLYPFGRKQQVLQIRASHIVQLVISLLADFDQAVKQQLFYGF